MDSASQQKVVKRNRFPLFQLVAVIGLLALVWYAFGKNVIEPAGNPVIAQRLGALELVSSTTGAEAIEQVSRLHGVKIDLVAAYIAEYRNQGERAVVWIGDSANREMATELIDRMVRGIEAGGTGFGNLRRITMDGNSVWEVDGRPGEKSFFYHSRDPANRVVWLTIESNNATSLLEMAVKTFSAERVSQGY